ncbi:hypothetical protein RRG08_051242 [Elysia crispata]|uniref:Uncharacterized protein n=1 Tax=Elysia crispata TaxID=231223 RepID=A0AAE0ZSN1_9GAST|nr:hypothetical protein RRG08_051242 [Elysia crispata]
MHAVRPTQHLHTLKPRDDGLYKVCYKCKLLDLIGKTSKTMCAVCKVVLSERKLSEFPSLMEFCVELYSKHIRSPFLMACMIDNYEEMLEQGKPKKEENLQNATQLCNELAEECDTLRREYWQYMSRSLASKYGTDVSGDS